MQIVTGNCFWQTVLDTSGSMQIVTGNCFWQTVLDTSGSMQIVTGKFISGRQF